MASKTQPRRNFFKTLGLFATAGFVGRLFLYPTAAHAAELKTIDMSGKKRADQDNKDSIGLATGLGYVENLQDALKTKKTSKSDRPAGAKTWKVAEQTCDTCMFYNYKKETPEKATCQLLTKVLVHPKGSCNSWQPKA